MTFEREEWVPDEDEDELEQDPEEEDPEEEDLDEDDDEEVPEKAVSPSGRGEPPEPRPTTDPSHIIPRSIEEEMQTSYIDYAMSVIVGRALPDVRDGLKPVHRRVLYAMGELGMTHNRPFKKSARIVGEVLGKYHPHGDQSVYDTLVRLAQPFSLRYPLVDGQGNFGSVDGDRAASMRYTEARLRRMAEELLQDLDKETVPMVDNFDGSLQEPLVIPSKFPNLLVNGSTGIAVGMATNMAPHNLNEAVDACIRVIDDPEVETDELIEIIPAPDFPTGGEIYGLAGVHEAYRSGRGRCKIRARYEIEELEKGKQALIIYEIPYQVNKSKLLEDIAKLVKDRKVDGITDLRDESDRNGMRIVIELRRDAIPEVIMNHLFKHTQMQVTFGIINIALVDNEPRELGLKAIIRHFLDHRFEMVTKRTEFELRKAKARAHILDGLIIALDNLDEVIELIRANRSIADASQALQERFLLSELQAKAILEMRLSKLTGLEREAIKDEFQELTEHIERLTRILADPAEVYALIRAELEEVKERYGDARRTGYVEAVADIEIEDLIPREDVLVTISNTGYIKRLGADTYRTQRRGGVGLIGMETKEKDFVVDMFRSHSHHYILFITNRGQLFWLKTYLIPVGGRHSKGKPIINLLPRLEEGEEVQSAIPVDDFDETRNLLFATRNGVIKKTPLFDYRHVRISGVRAIRLDEGDELITTKLSSGNDQVILASSNGKAARFDEDNVRITGRVTRGVRGLRLKEGDHLVDMALVANLTCERCRRPIRKADTANCPECDHLLGTVPDLEEPPGIPELLTITENGYGKRSPVEDYRHIKRGGVGVITIKTNERNGNVVGVRVVSDVDHLICTSKSGMIIRMPIGNIRSQSRNTQGVRLMQLKKRNDRLQAVTVLRGAALELDEGAELPDDGIVEGAPQDPSAEE